MIGAARQKVLAEEFERSRPRLVRVAYAVLGGRADAEDVVADTWLRLVEADHRDRVRDVEGWAVVAVARRALDVLRSARVRRESYVGPWLPEPVLGPAWGPGLALGGAASVHAHAGTVEMHGLALDPADRVTLDETVGYALLVVLESLTPAERTAWVLHDLFGVPFDEVAQAVGRTPDAVRQLAARARRHVTARAPRVPVDREQHRAVVDAFLRAAAGGDLPALLAVLDPEVTVTSDGGGEVSAARRPVRGAERAARFLLGLWRKQAPAAGSLQLRTVNGLPGLAVYAGERLVLICSLSVDRGRILRVDLVRAPTKLAHAGVPAGAAPGGNGMCRGGRGRGGASEP